MQFGDWSRDTNRTWRSLVIATSSSYVVEIAIEWVESWERNGWIDTGGVDIMDVDLWVLFLKEIRILRREGVHVSFWKTARNEEAYEAAKEGAGLSEQPEFLRVESSADGRSDNFSAWRLQWDR